MRILKFVKNLNIVTSVVIVLIATFIILRPLFPEIILAVSANEFEGYVFQSEKAIEKLGEKAKQLPDIPNANRIVIPKIYVNSLITEGNDESALNQGMWRRPNTSTPPQGGNTVLTGHRFLYTSGTDTFYHLDKIVIDDLILVYWQGEEYVYKAYEIIEVSPENIEVEYNTLDPILTLYTCTPLWTAEKRLVVKAKLQ